MKLKNNSQYSTRILRRILEITWEGIERAKMMSPRITGAPSHLTVEFTRSQKLTRLAEVKRSTDGKPSIYVRILLQPLSGSEFIPLMRQLHGGQQRGEHEGLRSADVALCVEWAVRQVHGWVAVKRGVKKRLHPDVRTALQKAKIPEFVPIRVLRPKVEPAQVDRLQQKYDRACELERKWTTRLKLAQTKLKKARERKKRYAKRLAERQPAQEEAA